VPLIFGLLILVLGLSWLLYPFLTPLTPMTTLSDETDFARSSWQVYKLVFWITLVVFFLVEGFLVYCLVRFQKRSEELPEQTHGNTPLEIGWTAATIALVLVMFVPSCQQIQFSQGPAPMANPLKIKVDGRQWWWEFYYPEYDIVTANEIHLPAGRTALFDLGSTDVIHSFWFPRLGGKRDAVPGRRQPMWFTPEEPGVYRGQCVEYCGTSHANMQITAIVHTPEDFEAWVAQQKAPTPPSADPKVQQGQVAFLTTAACITCHNTFQNDQSVYGQLGPNLHKVGTRDYIASGMFENNAENLRRWLTDPQGMKPGALMNIVAPQCTGPGEPDPCCRDAVIGNCLGDETIDQLVAYLQSLK
jgi:cytochrome c oxidase subunit 2